jgi:hypothetical protein
MIKRILGFLASSACAALMPMQEIMRPVKSAAPALENIVLSRMLNLLKLQEIPSVADFRVWKPLRPMTISYQLIT